MYQPCRPRLLLAALRRWLDLRVYAIASIVACLNCGISIGGFALIFRTSDRAEPSCWVTHSRALAGVLYPWVESCGLAPLLSQPNGNVDGRPAVPPSAGSCGLRPSGARTTGAFQDGSQAESGGCKPNQAVLGSRPRPRCYWMSVTSQHGRCSQRWEIEPPGEQLSDQTAMAEQVKACRNTGSRRGTHIPSTGRRIRLPVLLIEDGLCWRRRNPCLTRQRVDLGEWD